MDFLRAIRQGKQDGLSFQKIARKIFLSYPSHAFVGEEDRRYLIFDKISEHFNVPLTSIHIAGSAQTGHSFHKGSTFTPGVSDLDIAIIDTGLFVKYMDFVCSETRNYKDLARFPKCVNGAVPDLYLDYLSRGIFRPDLMPMGEARSDINNFFGGLSARHGDLFRSINAAIYLSHSFFERKQRTVISNFLSKDVF